MKTKRLDPSRDAPLVSIVIPCFNLGDRLIESVESAIKQTYSNIEIVVVDDGSTDAETRLKIDELRGREDWPRPIRVYSKMNGGVGSATNFGVSHSRGKYFMPLGDDLIDPPYISEAVEAAERDDNLGIVYCSADFFGDVNGNWNLPPFSMRRQLWDNCIFVSALLRREDWLAVGGLDESMKGREDHDYMLKTLSLGRTVLRLEGRYFHYRRSGSSVNTEVGTNRRLLVESTAKMFQNNLNLYGDNAETFVDWIYSLIDERNDLANKYRSLEKARNTGLGRMVVTAGRKSKKFMRDLRKYSMQKTIDL